MTLEELYHIIFKLIEQGNGSLEVWLEDYEELFKAKRVEVVHEITGSSKQDSESYIVIT
jgi:hypothetical protein